MQFLMIQCYCPRDEVVPGLFYEKVALKILNVQLLKILNKREHQKHKCLYF